ncbi:Acetyltransferase (GNAT) family protein [Thalassobacillus cyri]|uniref:Acetyltransferase (GNAT) family protein n=1 Tax=Thalassobacillus cyri TaxID=571932 RepID=A0A1H3ZPP9_9BACI|nr:GNAT family N-acetyltransferase [Thalassobacillus cyri]SEA25743.1 Acetyltransferase (GNAT) family protein [Thalassobacillus cyri]
MKIVEKCSKEDYDLVKKKVIEHNMEQLPDHIKTPNETIGFLLKDEEGIVKGGITGNMFWHHMHIEFLWVDKSLRGKGYGRELLRKLEEFAVESECRLIYLDTFSFQAPDFYQNNGFQVFGVIEDHPKGFNQYFLQKRLTE